MFALFLENRPVTGQQDVDLDPWQESSSSWGWLKQDGFVCVTAVLPLPSFLSLSTYGRSLRLCIPGVPPCYTLSSAALFFSGPRVTSEQLDRRWNPKVSCSLIESPLTTCHMCFAFISVADDVISRSTAQNIAFRSATHNRHMGASFYWPKDTICLGVFWQMSCFLSEPTNELIKFNFASTHCRASTNCRMCD